MNVGELAAKWERSYRIAVLYLRDGGICPMCRLPMLFHRKEADHPRFATIDHIVPVSKGGANCNKNLRLACKTCNQGRGNFYTKDMGGLDSVAASKIPLGESIHKSVRDRVHLIYKV